MYEYGNVCRKKKEERSNMQEKDRQSLCTGKRIAVILTMSILVLATAGMALWNVFAGRVSI